MKIGIDARMYSSSFTGIGRYTHELIKHLVRIDKDNTYVIFLNEKEFEHFSIEAANITKVQVDAPHYSVKEQTVFLKEILKHKIDLMHFTHFNAPLLYNKPFVVTIHDLTPSFYKGKKRVNPLERMGYNIVVKNSIKKSKHIIAVSENTKKDIQKLFQIPAEKISVIYEAVGEEFKQVQDQESLKQTKQKYSLSRPFLLYTGVWRDHKNVTGLIKAFGELRKQDQDIDLVITGKEDPYYPEVKELPKQLGVEKFVRLVGFVSEQELIDLYNLATLFVFPSLYEGFGLPVLESMACGTPVVASNVSSIPEVCGEACMLFNPEDTNDMANKIQQVLQDKELQEKMIEQGFTNLKKFSWGKMVQETLQVYQKI